MSAHNWTDVWKLFLDTLSRENIAMQIGVGLGAAFFAVMALEGVRASFFPKRIAEAVALRNVQPVPVTLAPPPQEVAFPAPEQDMRAAAWPAAPQQPVGYSLLPRITVNADTSRRSSPRPLRVIGARKPS
jgi:hypothetical protein